MTSRWTDPEFVKKWDQSILMGNPIRSEQIDIIMSVIERIHEPGGAVLDIGMGSGQLEDQLLRRILDVTVVGIDISAPMLDIARSRLSEFEGRFELIEHDYNDLDSLELQRKDFQAGICFDVIHHAQRPKKAEVLRYFFDHLDRGGVLFLGDKVELDVKHFEEIYKAAWERLEAKTDIKSGWDGDRFIAHAQKHKHGSPTLEEHIRMLRDIGFTCSCLYMHLDRVLIACIKT